MTRGQAFPLQASMAIDELPSIMILKQPLLNNAYSCLGHRMEHSLLMDIDVTQQSPKEGSELSS